MRKRYPHNERIGRCSLPGQAIIASMYLRRLPALVVSLAIIFGASLVLAAPWAGPTAAPTGGNVEAPINVSSSAQTKVGDLTVNGALLTLSNVGANNMILFGSNRFIYFGSGTGTYGIIDSGGVMGYKNSGGSWTSFVSGASQWTTSGTNIYNSNTGNVGIGTASPGALLNVKSGTNADSTGQPSGTFASIIYNANNVSTANGLLVKNNWATSASTVFEVGQDFVGGAYRSLFKVQGDGNVGIGTVSPTQKLDVAGNVNVSAGSCFMVNGTCITSGTNYWMLGTTWTANDTVINNTGGIIAVKNNVGASNGWATMNGGDATHAGYFAWFNPSGTRLGYMGFDNTDVNLNLENGADFAITNGSVGIGTTNPGAKLHVKSGTNADSTGQPSGMFASIIYNANNVSTANGLLVKNNWATSASTVFEVGGDLVGGAYRSFFKVTGDGNAYFSNSVSAGAFIYNSDRRLKKNIAPLPDALSKIMQLEGVTYNWIDPAKGTDNQIGFIAQDVEKVVPEIVTTDASTTLKAIDYARLTPIIVNAIKEQEAKIDAQQKEIDELRAQIEAMGDR